MTDSGRRAAKNKYLAKRISAVIVSIALAGGSLIAINSVASASDNFTVPAGGLNFTSPVSVENVTSGTIRTYADVDGNGTVAKVEVLAISNSVARITDSDWALEFDTTSPTHSVLRNAGVVNYRVAYKTDADANYTLSPAYSKATLRVSLTNLRQVADEDSYTFIVRGFDGSDSQIDETVPIRVSSGNGPWRATYENVEVSNRLQFLDERDRDSDVIDGFLRTEVRQAGASSTTATVKVSFESSAGVARTFTSLRLNSYDLDNEQFIEFHNVTANDITVGANVVSVSETGTRKQFVQAYNTSTTVRGTGNAAFTDPLSTSYTIGKVSVMYSNVSTLTFMFGYPPRESSNASFEFDFGDRVAAAVASSQPVVSTPTSTPEVVAIDVAPTNITVESEIITVLGANLDRVDSVWIGGVNVPIISQNKSRLQVRAPKGLSGLVDLELKSILNNVLMVKKLNFGGTAAAGTRKATLIVGGFAHNSRVLTPRMKKRIDRWLERNSDLGTLTCTGFTSLPRRTTDVALSTNRGKTACNFSKRQRSDLETSVSQGIEDPRPGSKVRRVRLVLTP